AGVVGKYKRIQDWLQRTPPSVLSAKMREAELLFRRIGITFAVYKEGGDPERLIPFDIIPRVLDRSEWELLERSLKQPVPAIKAFWHDAYHAREFIGAERIDDVVVLHNEGFRPEMQGFDPPQTIYAHISGIDIVRTGPEEFYVLEDNCRTPSGVSYMLENR